VFRFVRLLIAAVLCAVVSAPVFSFQGPVTHTWPDVFDIPLYLDLKGDSKYSNYTLADFSIARAKADEIKAELAAGESEWSGDFGRGMDLSFERLRWAPRSGFVQVTIYTRIPSVRQLNYGTAVEHPDSVDLVPVIGLDTLWKPGSVRRLIKVKWGEERYLIPEHQVGSFCDYVAGLGEFNGERALIHEGEFYRKFKECGDPAYDLPVLPPGYEHLVKRSIDVSIVAIGTPFTRKPEIRWDDTWEDVVTPVTINAGSSAGVSPGMDFLLFHSDRGEVITITKVGTHTSVGEIARRMPTPGLKRRKKGEPGVPVYDRIRIGWRATTSLHKVLAGP